MEENQDDKDDREVGHPYEGNRLGQNSSPIVTYKQTDADDDDAKNTRTTEKLCLQETMDKNRKPY